MIELTHIRSPRGSLRCLLLATVSGLIAANWGASANAADGDRPTVWIELGGQLERMSDGEQRFAPPFVQSSPRPSFETVSPIATERPPRYSNGFEGKVVLQPENSDWQFSASMRYGRANSKKSVHQQDPLETVVTRSGVVGFTLTAQPHTDTDAQHNDSYSVIDFAAGKDVGLGIFGRGDTSILAAGVRLAQFSSRSSSDIESIPDAHFDFKYFAYFHVSIPKELHHTYLATSESARSFAGIGPALSWSGSHQIAGNEETSQLAVDWGVNGSLLFGRQKARGHHQTTAYYQSHGPLVFQGHDGYNRVLDYKGPPKVFSRSRSVMVPNLGAFLGLSARYDNAKISMGYRADFFFRAMDGGIDTRKTYDRNFYGPFATISIGLGG